MAPVATDFVVDYTRFGGAGVAQSAPPTASSSSTSMSPTLLAPPCSPSLGQEGSEGALTSAATPLTPQPVTPSAASTDASTSTPAATPTTVGQHAHAFTTLLEDDEDHLDTTH